MDEVLNWSLVQLTSSGFSSMSTYLTPDRLRLDPGPDHSTLESTPLAIHDLVSGALRLFNYIKMLLAPLSAFPRPRCCTYLFCELALAGDLSRSHASPLRH